MELSRINFRSLSIAFLIIFVAKAVGGLQNDQSNSQNFERPTTTAENDAVKEWFSEVLGINKPSENVDGGGMRQKTSVSRARTPLYVQNLYDRMVLKEEDGEDEQVPNRRRRRNLDYVAANVDDGPMTIQAVTRDEIPQNKIGGGSLLQFNLEKLWIPKRQLRFAELVLAVDFSRLTGPPNFYSVLSYLVGPSSGMNGPPRLFIGSGSMGQLDTFQKNFIKMNVTDAVVRSLAGGSQMITFEIYVARADENGVASRDLEQQEAANLLHLSSHGAHQPVLVLYSTSTEGIQSEIGPVPASPDRYRRRIRRSIGNRNGSGGCHLIEWWIDLAKLFKDQVIAPEGFNANFCGGTCHNPLLNGRWNATANAHLRSAYNVKWRAEQAKNGTDEPSNVPEAQCVPQSYSPITVIFSAKNSFVMKRLDMVIINSCMCA